MKKVITYGTFDLFHYGHLRLLERAKALGDWLIVGVTSERFDKERGKQEVRQGLMDRIENVRQTGLADEIIIEEFTGQKKEDIQRYGADIFTVGSDWEGKFDYLRQWCEVVYLPRTEGVSSTELREQTKAEGARAPGRPDRIGLPKKLFTLGPVEMFPETRVLLSRPLPYFRTAAFSDAVLECAARLKRVACAPEGAHALLLTCSGTGAMEAAVSGCFGARDRLLVVDGGGFGHRFAELCAHHRIPHEAVKVPFGAALSREMLETALSVGSAGGTGTRFTGLLVNHHDTSVGRLYDLDMIADFCRAHGLYLIVDAIGSFLADPVDFAGHGIDALIVSSQKGLALPPGLAALLLSDRLFQTAKDRVARPAALYFDLVAADADAQRGQTPFTPAVGTILALRQRLEMIEEGGGAAAEIERTAALAREFRARLAGLPVATPTHPLSNACTPLLFPDGGAGALHRRLSEEHGVWLNPNGGELADKLLRVGHLGNLSAGDGEMLASLLASLLTEGHVESPE
ncbi:MAG: aminotransferase class V-fold PLP-dependent enzyme [Clostridiales Family XIII bacterium]|jgi:glycerol-3-phosphate cytidylyltransferase|nr:aminotransferase class V-fold PLP-dependent enzyme [Clostridiales Family XIII bacterium]